MKLLRTILAAVLTLLTIAPAYAAAVDGEALSAELQQIVRPCVNMGDNKLKCMTRLLQRARMIPQSGLPTDAQKVYTEHLDLGKVKERLQIRRARVRKLGTGVEYRKIQRFRDPQYRRLHEMTSDDRYQERARCKLLNLGPTRDYCLEKMQEETDAQAAE